MNWCPLSTVHAVLRHKVRFSSTFLVKAEKRKAYFFHRNAEKLSLGCTNLCYFFLSPPPIFGVLNSLSSKKTNECTFECQVTKRNYQHFKHNYTATFNGRSHQDWQPLLNTFLPLQGTWNVQTGYCLIGSMFRCI